jgi:hypothetical protein
MLPHHLLPCLLLLLCLPLSSSSDADLLLTKVKPALQGTAPNAQLATWNTSTPLCLWRGLRWSTPDARPLRCDTPAARANLSFAADPGLLLLSLRLPAAALAGTVPPELAAFPALESVVLAANRLSGPVPPDLGNAPALTVLDLSRNRLSAALPTSLWNLCDRATDIRLHGNALTGAVPAPADPDDTTCARLRVLDLGDNRLSGGFPSFVTAFRALQRLDLAANRLQGPIPDALADMPLLRALNLSHNNFSGQLPPAFSRFAAQEPSSSFSFLGNDPSLCGPPLRQCVSSSSSSGLTSRGVAGMVIGIMAAAVVLASVSIGWAQGRWTQAQRQDEEEEDDDDGGGEGRLMVFEGGDHLTLEEVLNATGQVVHKATYCTVYKAKLGTSGGTIELRLLREGCCKDAASCAPVVRRIGRARHHNLVPLRAFYQGRRGEKLLVYDHFPRARTLHDLLHGGGEALPWPRRHKIALGAARALAYLHAGQGEAHGNVRSSNVVVDELSVARLAEHALDRLLVPAAAEAVLAAAKADGYRAPELQSMRRCSARTDVYAFGILLLELLMGRKPSATSDLPSAVKVAVLEEAALEELLDAELLKGPAPAEEGLVKALKLAMGCCAPVPAARPTMAEVVRQLEESRPRRSAMYSPTESRSDAGTPTTA